MDKEIAISIRPENVKNILNGIKTIEVRTKFPNISKIKVYIYVTKDYKNILFKNGGYGWNLNTWGGKRNSITTYNGKVVASFMVDKVEEIRLVEADDSMNFETETLNEDDLCKKSCLPPDKLNEYLDLYKEKDVYGYAIHITNLEIFDKPKELSEFGIKRAPQSWMYVRENLHE